MPAEVSPSSTSMQPLTRNEQPHVGFRSHSRSGDGDSGDAAPEDNHGGSGSHGHGHGHGHHHHIHAPLDTKKALGIGSLGFEPIFNAKYNQSRVSRETTGYLFISRSLPIMIGLLTAVVAVGVGEVSEKLGELRTETVRHLIVNRGWFTAWLAEFGFMTAMALVGGFCVFFFGTTKTAGSSGIPQLIALLNGCAVGGEFSVKHLLVKAFGVGFAVASGLVAGPEGPMIFIGASIGYLCSRIPLSARVWRVLGEPPATVGDDVFTRDYTSIGAACGIAAAFRAPIAGTLFIVEEASSHFRKEQMSLIFFGGLAALEVILVTGGTGAVLEYKVQVGPNCSDTPWWSFFFLVILGLICGLLGAAFNAVNIKVMTWRARHCSAAMPRRRVLELVALCLISSAAWIGAASMFGETEASTSHLLQQSNGCFRDKWRNQILTGSVVEQEGEEHTQKFLPKPCLFGVQYSPDLCGQVFDLIDLTPYAKTCLDAVQSSDIAKRADYRSYCCAFDSISALRAGRFQVPSNASCSIDLGDIAPSLSKDDKEDTTYSSMGVMALVPFKTTCQNLFVRGVPNLLSLPQMAVFFVLFFFLGAITAGAAVPSGLLMPQMVMGGLVGRIAALLVIKMQTSLSLSVSHGSSLWAEAFQPFFHQNGGPLAADAMLTPATGGYLDPGIGALIGAAAFLGGSGRVTLFTTVMMVEITGDPVMIFPVGFATIFAVLMGNCINHGLYHSLIDVQSMPYLPDTWQDEQLPPGIQVQDMMPRNDPIVVPLEGGKAGIHAAVDGNEYTGFPLVNEDGVVIGLCERKYLLELLQQDGEVTADDLKYCSDLYPVTVRGSFPLQSAYQLFKSMDMKSLVVVDDHHRPLAVMTRFAFLAWRVADRLGDHIHVLHQREEERKEARRVTLRRRTGRALSSFSFQRQSRRDSAESTA